MLNPIVFSSSSTRPINPPLKLLKDQLPAMSDVALHRYLRVPIIEAVPSDEVQHQSLVKPLIGIAVDEQLRERLTLHRRHNFCRVKELTGLNQLALFLFSLFRS